MSRNQQLILGSLGLAIVLVYGCLGAYALIQLTERDRAQTPGLVQAAGTPAPATSPTTRPTGTGAETPPSQTSEGPGATNTRVIPPASPAADSPPPTATPFPTHTPQSNYTAAPSPTPPSQPTNTAGPAPPPQATQTVAPNPTSPPPPPPSPTSDTGCVEKENAHHLQMLADIAQLYEPILSWIEYEMEQAERDRDEMRIEDLQAEYEMCQSMKTADIDAEIARHQAALAACG